ncbi:MAG: histone deacetylase family protein [Chloroflexi bacterium]|nr:histone deacetylase family protein [Chloroflexota bacterium]
MMPLIYSPHHTQHQPLVEQYHGRLLPYPETPRRIESLRQHLERADLVCVSEPTHPISHMDLVQTHDEGFLVWFQQFSSQIPRFSHAATPYYQLADTEDVYLYPAVFPSRLTMSRLRNTTMETSGYYAFDTAAPIGSGTWFAALHSATAAQTAADRLLDESASAAYALCRPPGHHAGRDFVGGYCYLNNAAVAATRLLRRGEVAVIDIDYHHGNGTQDIFWNNPLVFFGSIHADPAFEYPYYAGYVDEIGGEGALNTNLNLPLPSGTGGLRFLEALEVLLSAVLAFEPATLVVSVGFDTSSDDPTATFELRDEDYHRIGVALASVNRPTLFVQEGGYNASVNGVLAEQLLRGFLGV